MTTCVLCDQPVHPGQTYFSAPRVEHAICRKLQEESLAVGAALVERNEARAELAATLRLLETLTAA